MENFPHPAFDSIAMGSLADMAADGDGESSRRGTLLRLTVNEQGNKWMLPALPLPADKTDIGRLPQAMFRRQHEGIT